MLIIAVAALAFAAVTGGRFAAVALSRGRERAEHNRRVSARQEFWLTQERRHAEAGRNIESHQQMLVRGRRELDRYFTEQGW